MQRCLIFYFYRRSTFFRRFLRPSSGAHNCTYSFRYCQPILLLAQARLTNQLMFYSKYITIFYLASPPSGQRLSHYRRSNPRWVI